VSGAAWRLRLGVVLLAAVGLQAALAGRWEPWGAAPDALVLAVATVAGAGGRRTGAAFGFAAGLAADLYGAGPLGATALAYTLVGHALGGPDGHGAGRRGPLSVMRRGALASAMAWSVLLATGSALGSAPHGPLQALAGRLLSGAAGGAVLAPVVSLLLAPLLISSRRRERALAIHRVRALVPAGAMTRR
jgi:rod shape-determining protein MreD